MMPLSFLRFSFLSLMLALAFVDLNHLCSDEPTKKRPSMEQFQKPDEQAKSRSLWKIAQEEGRRAEFLTPENAVAAMTVPDGFTVDVFAAEPMISQPMAFCWDMKGRLWVAENRDYETRQTGFSSDGTSRIVILEDTDRDGRADQRKVFLEGIPFPSAMVVGFDGLWLGAPPNLLFVPDRNRDDLADNDDIEVRLTGWGIRDRHETLNSFIWGPDGWLYGLQGFATPSQVGKPAGRGKIYRHEESFPEKLEFDGKPVDINGGVWRYHPTKDRFEVVAHGFSNPWGIDYDAKGQLFITACVIPHLWHVVPGGIYHRQGGSHFNPHVYSDIRTIADHAHQSAHGGAKVYQSDAFPEKYRGRIFMANIHEHAVLTDILEPKGSGFVGRHGDDFLVANNAQWVGFSVEVGPEGAVYVLDWHDADICGKEVLNKETGRVFRIRSNKDSTADFEHRYEDLSTLDDLALVHLQDAPSAWHATNARTTLQHRSTNKSLDPAAIAALNHRFDLGETIDVRLRAMWTLHVTNHLSEDRLLKSLEHDNEHLRAWAIQLLCEDFTPSSNAVKRFLEMAATEGSAVVRLYLAAAVQRIDNDAKWGILEKLSQREADADDHNVPKMLWFGLEPLVVANPSRAVKLAGQSKIPMLTRHIARRLGAADRLDELLSEMPHQSAEAQLNILLGLRDAFEGRFDVKAPTGWTSAFAKLTSSGDEVSRVATQLSQQFDDASTTAATLKTLRDQASPIEQRIEALQNLAGRRRKELANELPKYFEEPGLRREAIRAVAAFDEVRLSEALLKRYAVSSVDEKSEIIHALSSRTAYGKKLTEAIKSGSVPKQDVPAYVARMLRRVVGNSFVDVWGPIEELDAEKESLFIKYRDLLTTQALRKADLTNGKKLFQRSCAACHVLHGVGGALGPDITGANRSNLGYLLSNILTPSSIIQDAYRMHLILMDDGRIYSGIPAEENERQLKLRVADRPEPIVIAKSQIESREIAAVSMMPDGLLTNMKDADAIDLIAYLQSMRNN